MFHCTHDTELNEVYKPLKEFLYCGREGVRNLQNYLYLI